MTNTTDIASMTPLEIDTELARIYGEQSKVLNRIESTERTLRDERRALAPRPRNIEQLENNLDAYQRTMSALVTEATPYEDQYLDRRWLRYFLVANTNGHVHKDMACSTCFPTTRYNWLVDLADKPVDDMIEEWGETACTVCFPSAPTNPNYHRPSRRDREAQEARAAEKAAKQAEKDAKAIKDLDGSELRVEGNVIKTKVAARNKLSDCFQSLVYYGFDHPSDFAGQARKLIPVLRNAGVEWAKVAENAIKRAVKDSVVPPNNPYRLTPEQIKEGEVRTAANARTARDLLADAFAIYGAR